MAPSLGERQLIRIQPVSTYDTDSGEIVGRAQCVRWWGPGTPLYCPVVNTGRATAAVRSVEPIAKVTARNVRDVDCFRALLVHPTPADQTAKPPAETPPVQSSNNEHASPRGVDLPDANFGQLSGDQKQRLHDVFRPRNAVGLFPEETKGMRACTTREMQVLLIGEDAPPIDVKQKRFSSEQADAVQRETKTLAERGIART